MCDGADENVEALERRAAADDRAKRCRVEAAYAAASGAASDTGGHVFAGSAFRHLQTLELLRLVVDKVDLDDAFALALACTPFRAATCLKNGAFARFPKGIHTQRHAVWTSVARLAWARGLDCEWS